ncbi:Acetyltransferase (GNAT) family protein [Bacillus sp. THAF10]|uniref:GNAT family N-acetyltransferase n=1 Tax=Bacillus sp. THAF10 TaxID=2587848 RepID=UPI00126864EA|nr:GNAT family N-acetyltransferase [Bacillus sp. THAF10]QFT89515.1 Acetyltransferase (GNAT) family protein [Bacillus sp. THAF10]
MEVRRLSLEHHPSVIELFGKDEKNYQFVLNDLLVSQYAATNVQVFGSFQNNKLTAILFQNEGNLFFYENTNQSVECFTPFIKQVTYHKISGPSRMVEKLVPYLNITHDSSSYMGAVHQIKASRRYPELRMKRVKTEDELGMQYNLFSLTEEFKGSLPKDKQAYIDCEKIKIVETSNRNYYVAIDGKMVACAATVKETETSAIIIGVFTDPEFRGKGYGTEVLIALFDQLLIEGKVPYLFYSNPAARSVYKNLGMDEVCEWRVLYV